MSEDDCIAMALDWRQWFFNEIHARYKKDWSRRNRCHTSTDARSSPRQRLEDQMSVLARR